MAHDCYIEFDEYGQKAIYCMGCLKEILSQRDIIEINGKSSVVQKRNSSYNQKDINALNDGKPTVFTAILCNECKNKEIDIDHLIAQVKLGTRRTCKHQGLSDTDTDKVIKKHYKLTKEDKIKKVKV